MLATNFINARLTQKMLPRGIRFESGGKIKVHNVPGLHTYPPVDHDWCRFGRLPELFCGFKRLRGYGSTLYPVACLPQAWASATPFTLLEASLGLEFDPFNGEIRLRNPRLPAFLDEVVLRNLQLGQSTVDVRVLRRNDTVLLDTLRTTGDVRISIV